MFVIKKAVVNVDVKKKSKSVWKTLKTKNLNSTLTLKHYCYAAM